jgi:histidinol-phosphate aminotransferase
MTERSSPSRASYREIDLYAPDRAPSRIDLSDNTNRWGVPPAAQRVLSNAATEQVTRYPDLYASALKRAIAERTGVPLRRIVTGCGSDDVLDSAIRALAEPGETIAGIDPSFAMIPLFARMNGLRYQGVPIDERFDVDPAAFERANARLIYLCVPNNPTGTMLPRGTIDTIVDNARGRATVIIDEAYADFAPWNVLDLATTNDHVLVVRTLSKAYGLAGLRVGYAVGAAALVGEVEKSRGPYKVNALAEAAAAAALAEDGDWVREHIRLALDNRDRLSDALRERGLDPLPSASNFVLVPIAGAARISTAMRERGVAVRPFASLPAITPALRVANGDALRISVGPWNELAAMLTTFDSARDACA